MPSLSASRRRRAGSREGASPGFRLWRGCPSARPNRFRCLFGSFGAARDGASRPLAMGLTTLAIAGQMSGSARHAVVGGAGSSEVVRRSGRLRSRRSICLMVPRRRRRPAKGGAPQAASSTPRGWAWASAAPTCDRGTGPAGEDLNQRDDSDYGPVAIAAAPKSSTTIADDSYWRVAARGHSGTLLIIGLGPSARRGPRAASAADRPPPLCRSAAALMKQRVSR